LIPSCRWPRDRVGMDFVSIALAIAFFALMFALISAVERL
jgi:hypothetical protein